jgi:hypothetical protein
MLPPLKVASFGNWCPKRLALDNPEGYRCQKTDSKILEALAESIPGQIILPKHVTKNYHLYL